MEGTAKFHRCSSGSPGRGGDTEPRPLGPALWCSGSSLAGSCLFDPNPGSAGVSWVVSICVTGSCLAGPRAAQQMGALSGHGAVHSRERMGSPMALPGMHLVGSLLWAGASHMSRRHVQASRVSMSGWSPPVCWSGPCHSCPFSEHTAGPYSGASPQADLVSWDAPWEPVAGGILGLEETSPSGSPSPSSPGRAPEVKGCRRLL